MVAFETGKEIARVELHSLRLRDGFHIPDLLLSETEKQRASAFRSREARRLFVAARVLCRSIVAAIVDCTPQALSIAITPSGRPFLPDYPEIDFNLSHTGDTVALAVCHGGHIGIDIERLDAFSESEAREIMPLILSESELNDIKETASGERQKTFLSYWVRKEAALKCLGDGFLSDPKSVSFDPEYAILDIVKPSSGETIFVRSGRFGCEKSGDFQWALATSKRIAEPIWHHHTDLTSFMRFL